MVSPNEPLQYPDVLGYITDGERLNLNVVQIAVGARPQAVRAGRPLEIMLLIQNASDLAVDVTVSLQLPNKDAANRKERFLTKAERLVVGVEGGEVGYASLPVSTLPDTAPGADYRIGVDVSVSPAEKEGKRKPNRVRPEDGGARFDSNTVPAEMAEKIEELKQWHFHAGRGHSGRRSRHHLEIAFAVMSGHAAGLAKLQPGYTCLWSLADQSDDKLLLRELYTPFKRYVFPPLKRERLLEPLREAVCQRLGKAGYEPYPLEAELITRLLTRLLEIGPEKLDVSASVDVEQYNIMKYYQHNRLAKEKGAITLPAWASTLLRLGQRDERTLRYPIPAILQFAFDDLLADAMRFAFERLEVMTGEDFGSAEDRETYIQNWLTRFHEGELGRYDVYLPLVLGGLVIFDQVLLDNENPGSTVLEAQTHFENQLAGADDNEARLLKLAGRLVEQMFMKYNFNEW